MNLLKNIIPLALVSAAVACSGGSNDKGVALKDQSDSLSYIIGLSLAESVYKVDTMVDVDILCKALRDQAAGKPLMDIEQARTAFLRYMLYVEPERRRSLEAQYIKELVEKNRSYTLDKEGVAYNITEIGNEKNTPKNSNDWVVIRYAISNIEGKELFSSLEQGDSLATALGDLPRGVQASVKHIGEGGKVEAWIPSSLAYGEGGSEELGVEPFQTLHYNIELLKNELAAAKRYAPRDAESF